MAHKKRLYDVLSPDGFSIHPTKVYSTKAEMQKAFNEWKKRYIPQGYYSSSKHGRIPLNKLKGYCTFEDVTDKMNEVLIEDVIARVKVDLLQDDETAIAELLSYCPIENLIAFLPEDEQEVYKPFLK